jgi:hypothetical protein
MLASYAAFSGGILYAECSFAPGGYYDTPKGMHQ